MKCTQSPSLHIFLSHPSFLRPQSILILFIICYLLILCLLTRPRLLCPVCVHCKTPQRNLFFLQPQEHQPQWQPDSIIATDIQPTVQSCIVFFPASSVASMLEQRISSNLAWLPSSDHPRLQKAKSQPVTHRDRGSSSHLLRHCSKWTERRLTQTFPLLEHTSQGSTGRE